MAEPTYRHIEARTQDGVLILTLTMKEFRGDTLAEEVREEFLRAAAAAETPKVAVDFQHVSFMATAGCRPLLTLLKKVRERGGGIVLCNLPPLIKEELEVMRLVTSKGWAAPFAMEPDIPSAVARLKSMTPAQA